MLSFLSSLINFIRDRDLESKYIKKAKEYAGIYSLLSNESKAKKDIDQLLARLTQKLLEQEDRKINVANIIAVIFVAMVGGGLSYLLAFWAMYVGGFWSIFIWIMFTIVMLFTIGLSAAGWASRYRK